MYGNNESRGRSSNYGGGYGDRPRSPMGGGATFAPVKVGEEMDVTIEAVGEKGDGICKKKGFVLFVPNTKQGDTVRIRITKVLRKVGFAEVIGEEKGTPEQSSEQPAPEAAPQEEEVPQGEESEDFGDEQQQEEQQ